MRIGQVRAIALVMAAIAQILVFAPAASAQAGGWQPGPGGALDNTYAGFVDVPSNGATVPGSGSFPVVGWFSDSTAQGWAGADDVQVWLGSMDSGGGIPPKEAFSLPPPHHQCRSGHP